jgi:hypothetical protein
MGTPRPCLAAIPEPGCTLTFQPRVGNQKRCPVCYAADRHNGKAVKLARGTMAPDGTPIAKPRPATRGPYYRTRLRARTTGEAA